MAFAVTDTSNLGRAAIDLEHFADTIRRAGMDPISASPWLSVGRPQSRQGWKLHISAIPTQAETLLERVVGTFFDFNVAFKVAADVSILEALNDGRLGNTQIGKFITVYPELDALLPLAEALHRVTAGFDGPTISTDRRLGDVLYTRYGNFVYQRKVDRLGLSHRVMARPDGSWTEDAYHVPFQTPAWTSDPFENWSDQRTGAAPPPEKTKIFGPGFLIADVLYESVHGACFLALDVRSRENVQPVVLKQARHLTMSDRFGRDAQSRLRVEYETLQMLDEVPGIVSALDFFTKGSSSFLVLEHVEGQDFETTVNDILQQKRWADATREDRQTLLRHLSDLASSLKTLHSRGVVHRDLNNTNVRIAQDRKLYLLDFEMAHRLGNPSPSVGAGTAGFNSAQQRAGKPPAESDDIFSFGCLALLALTGIDPRRFDGNVPDRPDRISKLTGPAIELAELYQLVASCLSDKAENRPQIGTLIEALDVAQAELEMPWTTPQSADISEDAPTSQLNLAPIIESAVEGLMQTAPQTDEGLWKCLPFGGGDQGVLESDLILARSAHSGVAGPVYVLSLAAQHGFGTRATIGQRLTKAAQWLTGEASTDDASLPGLHFGQSGVASALFSMGQAGWDPQLTNAQLSDWMTRELDWPDVTHGAAGQGLAALNVAPEHSDRAAQYLCETQCPDGAWLVPAGLGTVSGQKLTGFAHGTAGVVYFLCLHARARGDAQSLAAAQLGLSWLERMKQLSGKDSSPQWPYSDQVSTPWRWWCHGGPGIALAYIAAYEAFGNTAHLRTAICALEHHHPLNIRYGNLSYCHGLAGLGHIYLEALRVTDHPRWRARVDSIIETILALSRTTDHGTTWLAEDPAIPTADLGLGMSGVVHFLMRCHVGPDVIGLPLCPSAALIKARSVQKRDLAC